MLLRAFAKINLDLRVLGRRADGYHDIKTIFQAVEWCDEILLEPASRFEFSAPGTPEDETNLVVRAVRAYERLAGIIANVRIRVKKNIPIGRGLGGGSSDAAVTFIGLQRMFKRPLPFEQVPQVLRELGSDVPFFALGGRAAGYGRGDDATDYWVLLVDSGVVIPTAEAYSWLTVPDKTNSIEGFCAEAGSDCSGDVWTNDFEGPVFARYPELAKIKENLINLGAYRAALSGSGSTVFGQFQMVSDAIRAGSGLDGRFRVKLTKPLPRWEYFQKIVEE
ncbi:MAG: 4-(cytidine 5'-diphospho)-2-C-methyl-D-erythritol kinase [Acidobacteria bacterium]|nr:MAG: 4-(cytidine 5'-diphospho)-2-C-methyl-D-erythritol kinase [Acidobacteriota bacterium]